LKTCPVCSAEWPDDTKFCPNDGTTLRSAQGADLIGSVVADRYHIVKKLGEGGMGAVYLGEHVKMGRKSAIKVMAQSMANDPEAIARFNREAANAARINHPNVCAIYDFGETPEGTIYLAMEFIEGQSLSDVLRREGALPPDRAARILRQTGDALQAAHDLGIVHRDLKPDNIMLAKSRDGGDVVKVVDFGIAKAMTGEEGQQVTKTGLVVGTPEYMSPEQLSGDVLDGRSDIYSLALVFYRMLTGTLPFQADSAQEMMIKRLTDKPLPLNQAVPEAGFPDRLQQVLDKALERMPADRYTSAVQFAGEAEQSVRGFTGRTASAAEVATQLIDTGATQGIADALPETRVSRKPEPPTPTTPAPVPSPPRLGKTKRPIGVIVGAVAVIAIGGGTAAWMMLGGGAGEPGAPGSASPDSTVTGDTAVLAPEGDPTRLTQPPVRQQAGDRPGGSGTEPVAPAESTATPEPQPGLDIARIQSELEAFSNALLAETATATSRGSVEQIYRNVALPDSVRGRAALFVGNWFAFEGQFAEACNWYRSAADRDPDNENVRRALDSPACRQ